jgi:peptide/nickel transport system permease protein
MHLRRRFISLLVTFFAASVLIFTALEIAPGDVARFMMGVDADPKAVAALREELGLGGNAIARYGAWILDMARGDFGISYTYRVPVAQLIGERLAVSLPLALAAFALSSVLALSGAVLSVRRRGGWAGKMVSGLSSLALAIPNFWLAMMLMLLFSVTLQVLPAGGFPGWGNPLAALSALVLPTLALGVPQGAIMTRVLRASLLDVSRQDFMRTARAKGLSQRAALWHHGVPNALVPVLPIIGLQLAFLVAGAVIVENVFYLPGLGRLVLQAITQRDLITVKAVVMIMVVCVVFISFAMDVIAARMDPRLR